MKRQISLQDKLNRAIILTVLFFSIVCALIAGFVTYEEASEHQDYILVEMGRFIAHGTVNSQYANEKNPQNDKDESVSVHYLREDKSGYLGLSAKSNLGLQTITHENDSWRVFIGITNSLPKIKFVVTQNIEARNEIVFNSSISIFSSILLMLFFMLLVLKIIINSQFKPIVALSQFLDKQDPNHLQKLPTEDSFRELAPFLNSINRLIERTNESILRQRRFIADAAHELRTPITALSLLDENLDRAQTKEDFAQRKILLTQGLKRVKKLIVQLLDLAKFQNEVNPVSHKVRMDAILSEVITDLHPMIEKRNIYLTLDIEKNLIVKDQGEKLRQLFRNSIENAIFHTPEGSEINIVLNKKDDMAVFSLEDNGPGLPINDSDKIWQAFHRGQHSLYSGSGLGLPIILEISKQLQGNLKFINRPAGGAQFIYEQKIEVTND